MSDYSPVSVPHERSELVHWAGSTIRIGSRSFYMASQLFDRATRERAWLLYAWCRHCDDRCDGQELGGPLSASDASVIDELRRETHRALAGDMSAAAPYRALASVAAERGLPVRYIDDHLEGFALDCAGWTPQSEADLLRYCYHVAGTVGCMMAVVMGIDPDDDATLDTACALGLSFQLGNIARDVAEDHAGGRCYLPKAWMEEFGVEPADPMNPARRDALVALVGRLVDLSLLYEERAMAGIARLDFRSRWAIHSARSIYGGIGREVAARGAQAWDERVAISTPRKLAIVARSLLRAAA